MTASWKLCASISENKQVELAWNSRTTPSLVGIVTDQGTIIQREAFEEHRLADQWASSQGVKNWSLVSNHHIQPIAELIPINFPNAVPLSILIDASQRIKEGISLKVMANQLKVHPAELLAWLIGIEPSESKFQGWRRK